jgi:hypothetical protein
MLRDVTKLVTTMLLLSSMLLWFLGSISIGGFQAP